VSALYGLVAEPSPRKELRHGGGPHSKGGVVLARSLKGVGSLSAPGTSILMAWVDAASPLTESALDPFMKPGSQRLVMNFNSSERGAVLDATSSK
jgi:hypothetical protein